MNIFDYGRKLLAISAVMLVAACEKTEPEPDVKNIPVPVSLSLQDGTKDVPADLGKIVVTYNTPISVADEEKVSMSGMDVELVAANKTLTVSFGELQTSSEYRLSLKKGAIVSKSDKSPAEALEIRFNTEKAVAPPLPPYKPGTPGDYSASLVTENPIPEAVRLYSYLLSVYGSKSLSAAIADVDWNTKEADWIHKWTGRYPAIANFDYLHLHHSPSGWIDYGDISPASDWWKAKGLIGACWHWNVPASQSDTSHDNYTSSTDKTNFSPKKAVEDGTWENGVVKADLKKMAGYLKLLQDNGIPVIWRPLHEASGNMYKGGSSWFWWGRDGAKAYRDLWVYMFNYFEKEGVRNLIWVWTTNTSSESDVDYEYYPGDEYVDIVGRDVYGDRSNAVTALSLKSQFNTISSMIPHKMVALTEFGQVADMAQQWNAGAKWLFFMPWYDYNHPDTEEYDHSMADIAWWNASFASEAVIDRSELPSNLFE